LVRIALALAALVVITWLAMGIRSRDAQINGLGAEVAALAHSVRTLEQRPPEVRVQERTVVETARSTPEREQTVQQAPPAEQRRREQVELVAALPVTLARRLESEPADVTWASSTQHQLHDVIDKLASPGAHVTAVDCRTSLCRLEGSFDSKEAFNSLMYGIFNSSAPDRVLHGGTVAPVFEQESDGKYHATVYMSRVGTPLVPEPTPKDPP
jgi:hypothetical protein